MKTYLKLLLVGCLVPLALNQTAGDVAAQWGTLSGTFVYDGTAPAAPAVTVTKDVEFCGKHNLLNEALLVNQDNNGIANIVVHLYLSKGDKAPNVHPDYAQSAKDTVAIDNENCRFTPHVVLLRTTQTLAIGNKDPVGHNTKIDTWSPGNVAINPIVPAGSVMNQQFPAEERRPVAISCSIHPWMNAWMVVRDDPYMTVSNEDGKFEIKNLPVGEWTFQFWQEQAGYVQNVTVAGKKTTWKRGRLTRKIAAGANDLGEIKVNADNFKK